MDIIPVTFTNYNDTNSTRLLSLETNSNSELLASASDYRVCLRHLEVPINGSGMPINSTAGGYGVSIFNEYKPIDLVIPGLAYGVNHFTIPSPIISVEGFITSLNNIVFKKASPVQLGYFELQEDNSILFRYDAQYADEHDMIKIYFDAKLQKLFAFDYDQADKIGDKARFKAVYSYIPSASGVVNVVEVKASRFTFPLFFNLKGVRVYTDLPIPGTRIYAKSATPYSNISPLLTTISYNSMQMYNNSNLIYIPSTLFFNSLTSESPLNGFNLRFAYLYADGSEEPVTLGPLEYASATLSFEKE